MLNKSVFQARIPPARASVLVGPSGLEPPTSCLSGTRSNHLSYEPVSIHALKIGSRPASGGGDDGIRTHDPLLAGQVLSQLSYTPIDQMRFEAIYRFRFLYLNIFSRIVCFWDLLFSVLKILKN